MEKIICLNCGKEFIANKKRKYCSCKCFGKSNKKYDKYINKKYGRLTILYEDKNTNSHYKKYYCKCECGNIKSISIYNVINKRTESCGCLAKETTKKLKPNTKHNKSRTRIYSIWSKMKNRCYNEKYFQYYLWGGKGIKVCDEWKKDFMSFYNWAINNGYNDNLSIDRIDGNKNYEPSNCRWATAYEQSINTSRNIKIKYKGETHIIKEWAKILNIKPATLYWRYKNWNDINKMFKK